MKKKFLCLILSSLLLFSMTFTVFDNIIDDDPTMYKSNISINILNNDSK